MKRIVKLCSMMGLGALILMGAACSLYKNDHAYVSNEQYLYARDLFIQTGSLDLVERKLHDMEWTQGKINETLYRLQKQFDVQPEELPAAKQPGAAQPNPTPAK